MKVLGFVTSALVTSLAVLGAVAVVARVAGLGGMGGLVPRVAVGHGGVQQSARGPDRRDRSGEQTASCQARHRPKVWHA